MCDREVSGYCTVVVVCPFSKLYINICIKYGYCILIMDWFVVEQPNGAAPSISLRANCDQSPSLVYLPLLLAAYSIPASGERQESHRN